MSSYVKDDEWGTKYPHFQKSEYECPCCGSVGVGIATSLLETMEKLREKYGAIIITSGYRCTNYNAQVGGVWNSAHLKGQAADFVPASGITNDQEVRASIVNELKSFPNYHYAYCNYNGNYPNMGNAIHIDTILTDTDPQPEPSTGEYYYVNSPDGLWLLDENGTRILAYMYDTKVEFLNEWRTMLGYDYMKVKVLYDGNIGYMASQYLSKEEQPLPEPTPEPTPEPEPTPSDDELIQELESKIEVLQKENEDLKQYKEKYTIEKDGKYQIYLKKGEVLIVK